MGLAAEPFTLSGLLSTSLLSLAFNRENDVYPTSVASEALDPNSKNRSKDPLTVVTRPFWATATDGFVTVPLIEMASLLAQDGWRANPITAHKSKAERVFMLSVKHAGSR